MVQGTSDSQTYRRQKLTTLRLRFKGTPQEVRQETQRLRGIYEEFHYVGVSYRVTGHGEYEIYLEAQEKE